MTVRGMISHQEWRTGARLGEGNYAEVFELHDGLEGFVYKLYRVPLRRAAEEERLREYCKVGQIVAASPASSQRLVCWPYDFVVESEEAIAGVILPRVPASFFDAGEPRTAMRLFDPATAPPLPQRLDILYRLAAVLEFLAARDTAHGDVSAGNVLWAENGDIRLIDADSMVHPRLRSEARRPGSMFWIDPRRNPRGLVVNDPGVLIEDHDVDSDAYGLGLMVYRAITLVEVLDPARGHPVPDGPGVLARHLQRMAGDPLNEHGQRPTAAEWKVALDDVLDAPEELTEIDRWGTEVRERWEQALRDRDRAVVEHHVSPGPVPAGAVGLQVADPAGVPNVPASAGHAWKVVLAIATVMVVLLAVAVVAGHQ